MLENKGYSIHKQSWPQLEEGNTETAPVGHGTIHLWTPFTQFDSAIISCPVDRVTITRGL